jgi:hypothetical protein
VGKPAKIPLDFNLESGGPFSAGFTQSFGVVGIITSYFLLLGISDVGKSHLVMI